MCEQCYTQSVTLGEVVPGLILIQAKKDGRHMKAGDYGLVRSNDPDVIWTDRPEPDPYEGRPDEDFGTVLAGEVWQAKVQEFTAQCNTQLGPMGLTTGFRIGLLCQAAGYDHTKDGKLEYWLFHRMGVLLQAAKDA